MDASEGAFGRLQQVVALAGSFGGEQRVLAHDQTLARIVRRADLGEIAGVEERELQLALVDQGLDLRCAQAADPVEPVRLQILANTGAGDHAAITDEDDAAQPEARLELVDLRGHRARVTGIAIEDLDRHRTAIGSAQQAVDDLQLAAFAVAIVAEAGERAAAALEVARADVVEDQRAVLEMPFGEGLLDRRLALAEPVECRIELVLVDRAEGEHTAKARARRRRVEVACRRQLRGRMDDATDQQCQDEVTQPRL